MDPIDNDWLGNCKSEPVNDHSNNGNVARSWQWRERGMNPRSGPGNRTVLENIAEDKLVHKVSLNIRCCDLPGYPRSTFLMVFSPDGTKVASTHGNHNIYVSELASGKHVRVLKGHPRTPWCIAFHPSHAQLVGSGCLGGQVRVWDLSGGSETWTVSSETVIASIAFHPRDQLLVIATFNELYFWDWSQPAPFTKVCTNNVNEKVRFVAFDALGHKLITGITVWPSATGTASLLQTAPPGGSPNVNNGAPRGPGGPGAPEPPESPSSGNRQQEEMIVTSYNNLVQRYDSLVRNYHRLFLARTQGTSTTDRGTDPMEVDGSNSLHQPPGARYSWGLRSSGPRPSTSRSPLINGNPLIGGGSRDNVETSDPDASPSSRLLSLDVLSLDNNASGAVPTNILPDTPMRSQPFTSRPQSDGHLIFGSRPSAFQPLSDHSTDRTFSYAATDPQRRMFRRVLPNPFSYTSNAASQADLRQRIRDSSSSSRTRQFQSLRNLDTIDETDDELSRRIDQRLNRLLELSPAPPDNLHSLRPSTLGRVLQIGFIPSEILDHNRSTETRREELRRSMTRILRPRSTLGNLTQLNTRDPVLASTIPGLESQNNSPRIQNDTPVVQNVPPRVQNVLLRAQNDAPRFQNLSPRVQNVSSRAQNVSPRAQNVSPRAQTVSPRAQNDAHRAGNNAHGAQSGFTRNPRHDPIPNMQQRLQTLQELVQSIPALHDLPPRPRAPSPPRDPIGELFIDHGDHLEIPGQPNDGSRSPPFRGFSNPLSSSESNNPESSGTANTGPNDSNSVQRNADTSQTITRSLDIIRDILRDSGTRLLNLITDMSYSSLASVENGTLRRSERTNSEDGESRTSSDRRGNLLSSDSDSDHSLEVNIYRTRNATFPDNRNDNADRNAESDRPQRPANRMVVNLDIGEGETGEHTLNNNRINITVSNNRFRLRTNIGESGENTRPQPSESQNDTPSTSGTEQLQNVPTDLNRPSTSRNGLNPDSEQTTSSSEALRKVRLGIEALQRHTTTLTNMWLSGNQASMRDLRTMWEDLRRHIVALHRQSARQETPNYYVRSLLERCQMLTDMSRRSRRNQPGSSAATADTARPTTTRGRRRSNSEAHSNPPDAEQPSTSYEHSDSARTRHNQSTGRNRRSPLTSARFIWKLRCSPATRRRLQERWLYEDDIRKRHRMVITNIINRYMNRYTSNRIFGRSRRSFRSIDLYFTRYAIHLRSMQVLSVMFNLMMGCLEESELSGHIATMLRALKKSIGVTCLILMTIRAARDRGSQGFRRRNTSANNDAANNESGQGLSGTSQTNSTNIGTFQNGHNNNSTLLGTTLRTEEESNTNDISEMPINTEETARNPNNMTIEPNPDITNDVNAVPLGADRIEISTDHVQSTDDVRTQEETTEHAPRDQEPIIEAQEPVGSQEPMAQDQEEPSTSHKWSNRLDVQISAANKNLSDTAKRRKAVYLESKRQKVLHRVNPKIHPLVKKKYLPPLRTHRIPTSRSMPTRTATTRLRNSLGTQCSPNSLGDPIAGPSNVQPSTSTESSTGNPTRSQEYRAGLFRFAQFQAARLRNASRNRYRIRLYASVREILQSTNPSGDREAEDPTTNSTEENRQLLSTFHPRLRLRNNLESLIQSGEEGRRPFDSILNNVAVPLVHVNDLPINDVQGGGDAPPRVNEYLQPIILAQNALVVDEGGGGGLLEAGLVSELVSGAVSPTHRVQAWDFTNGEVPDIRDGTKNVVVQRCKIHNDASIDISRDGLLLVALLPVHRMRNMNYRLGVYSLEWATLGRCLHTAVLEQSAVSVALSPTARHLAVGLGSRRVTTLPQNRNNVFALVFRLAHEGPVNENSRHCGLIPVRILDQSWEHSPAFTSLNCLRWAPAPGQGLVLANNTGQLVIMS